MHHYHRDNTIQPRVKRGLDDLPGDRCRVAMMLLKLVRPRLGISPWFGARIGSPFGDATINLASCGYVWILGIDRQGVLCAEVLP
ncbi:MAG TPA: hypothetical protein VFE47_17515 [Tepidisphaeraceae bacterium]|jgi:hypothetical protein|nr:hypothetical protein [Tepidisphaeraceae bacterium]